MSKQNIVEQVSAKIDSMLLQRAQEVQAINTALATEKENAAAAENAANAAITKTDLPAYEAAKAAQVKANAAIEMYEARLTQLHGVRLCSESESDAVIASLLAYESDLAKKYEADIKEPLAALEAIHKRYQQAVDSAEKTITRWTHDIHPNFMSSVTTFAETGTHRSPRPIPVESPGCCDESRRVDKFLYPVKYTQGAVAAAPVR